MMQPHLPETMRSEPSVLRLHGLVTDIGYLLAGLGLAAMGVLYCMEVVLRYFVHRPTSWSLETVTFLMLIMMFLAVPHAVRAGMHIAVTLLADLYPKQIRRLAFIMNSIGLILCTFIAYLSLRENLAQYDGLIETNGNLVIPKWWLTAFITYGFANSALWYARLLCNGGRPIGPVLAIVRAPDGGAQR
ncbi:MAG: TRAP transporter small permease subunit [Rhizobiales bacterium]|nr:TRAP transporter small permease subunit [Hyphomicrobiales bacterium]